MTQEKKKSPPPMPVREPGTYAPRPKDAATIIIWRKRGRAFEVLMGERHRAHKFMPERYVFPGGRVDASDARIRSASDMSHATAAQLARTTQRGRGRSIAIAAIRETFEETGLIIGGTDPLPHRPAPPGWELFFGEGFAPALDRLYYVARAITPHFRPVRFDARFFMVEAKDTIGTLQGSGELEKLEWIPIRETHGFELANVTRRALEYAEEMLRLPQGDSPLRKVPYFRHVKGGTHERVFQ